MSSTQEFNLMRFSRTLGYQLRKTQVRLYGFFGPVFARHGLSPIQYALLSVVYENPGCSQVEVAKELAIEPSALVGLIDKLSGLGWMEKRQSKLDRRSRELYLTSVGQARYLQVMQAVHELDEQIRERFAEQELEQFSDVIRRMNLFFDEQGY